MTTVSCVGITVRDIIFPVEALPYGPGKTQVPERHEVGGGPAANASVTVTRLGGLGRFVGPVGDDTLGQQLKVELERSGVDTSRIRVVPGCRSPLSTVVVDGAGERSIVNHTDPRLFEAADVIDTADLEGSDAVLVDVRWAAGASAALDWAASRGVPGIVDFDIGAGESQPLLDRASHLVFSANAARVVGGDGDLERALRNVTTLTDAWVAATDGANGTMWIEDGEIRRREAYRVDVVDTTGAGDVYHGAFSLALAEAMTIEAAIDFASAGAALSCMRFGGRTGIPTRNELEKFLEERR